MGTRCMNPTQSVYRQNSMAGPAESDPRSLIEMLLNGCIDRLLKARGAMLRRDRSAKYHFLSSAGSMIEHLRTVIDLPSGGEIAQNLMDMYGYMLRRLAAAAVSEDPAALDEIIGLLREIKGAWDAMPVAQATRH